MNRVWLAFVSAVLGTVGCRPVDSHLHTQKEGAGSETQATDRGPAGKSTRCQQVLPEVEKVGIPLLKTILARADGAGAGAGGSKGSGGSTAAVADRVAKDSRTMIGNMMASSTRPIHPMAFLATIKDFESAANFTWSIYTGGRLNYFKTGNCTSGECFGLFQVDVKLEPGFASGAVCQSAGNGLGIWDRQGGADFCSLFYWWTQGGDGEKCAKISSGPNPCKTPGIAWDLDMVNKGRLPYVQQAQWGPDSWKENYLNYELCLTEREGSLQAALDSFAAQVGLPTSGGGGQRLPAPTAQPPVQARNGRGKASDDPYNARVSQPGGCGLVSVPPAQGGGARGAGLLALLLVPGWCALRAVRSVGRARGARSAKTPGRRSFSSRNPR